MCAANDKKYMQCFFRVIRSHTEWHTNNVIKENSTTLTTSKIRGMKNGPAFHGRKRGRKWEGSEKKDQL